MDRKFLDSMLGCPARVIAGPEPSCRNPEPRVLPGTFSSSRNGESKPGTNHGPRSWGNRQFDSPQFFLVSKPRP